MNRFLQSLIVVLVAGASFYGVKSAVTRYRTDRYQGRTPLERALVRSLRAQGGYSEFVAMAKATGSAEAAQARGMQLSSRGISRLSPDDQARRIEVLDRLLATLPPDQCAAYARGTLPIPERASIIQSMDSLSMDSFADVAARALLAELRGSPPRFIATEQQTAAFIEWVAGRLTDSDEERFMSALTAFDSASDDDACWVNRTMYRAALSGQGDERGTAVRILTSIEAQPAK